MEILQIFTNCQTCPPIEMQSKSNLLYCQPYCASQFAMGYISHLSLFTIASPMSHSIPWVNLRTSFLLIHYGNQATTTLSNSPPTNHYCHELTSSPLILLQRESCENIDNLRSERSRLVLFCLVSFKYCLFCHTRARK